MILDSFVIVNQAITDCDDYLTLIMTGSVITWASASSLKAFTRESSFSFSKAHWEKRQLQKSHERRGVNVEIQSRQCCQRYLKSHLCGCSKTWIDIFTAHGELLFREAEKVDFPPGDNKVSHYFEGGGKRYSTRSAPTRRLGERLSQVERFSPVGNVSQSHFFQKTFGYRSSSQQDFHRTVFTCRWQTAD